MCLLGLKHENLKSDPYLPPNPRWQTAAILKMVLSLYLSWESSNFNDIWYPDPNFDSKNGHVTKESKKCKYPEHVHGKTRNGVISDLYKNVSKQGNYVHKLF